MLKTRTNYGEVQNEFRILSAAAKGQRRAEGLSGKGVCQYSIRTWDVHKMTSYSLVFGMSVTLPHLHLQESQVIALRIKPPSHSCSLRGHALS